MIIQHKQFLGDSGLLWEYSAQVGNEVMYILTPVKPTSKQKRQVKKKLRSKVKGQ